MSDFSMGIWREGVEAGGSALERLEEECRNRLGKQIVWRTQNRVCNSILDELMQTFNPEQSKLFLKYEEEVEELQKIEKAV